MLQPDAKCPVCVWKTHTGCGKQTKLRQMPGSLLTPSERAFANWWVGIGTWPGPCPGFEWRPKTYAAMARTLSALLAWCGP